MIPRTSCSLTQNLWERGGVHNQADAPVQALRWPRGERRHRGAELLLQKPTSVSCKPRFVLNFSLMEAVQWDRSLGGGCACGRVRYRLGSPPMFVHCCHCLRCQRETGSAFVLNALIETDRVELMAGVPEPLAVSTDSGRSVTPPAYKQDLPTPRGIWLPRTWPNRSADKDWFRNLAITSTHRRRCLIFVG
jgi:hypothetical protein